MFGIKKLDQYILRKFLPLFVAAFFICLFVFMMQFTWRYVEELIGKGLSLEILVQFFWYMGISLIPTSLPLSVLLASLITFGNMGEQFELLSMKAAGVSLLRIMRPILIVVLLLTGISFYFQNVTAPHAQIQLRNLLISMKQQSPAVEIPEGVFYSGIPNVNLYVQKKNAETGMLYDMIIYKTDQGFDRAQIVLADSGRMEMTADKMHLILELWQGEQFENLQSAAAHSASVPYDRETFAYKRMIIDFDSNFNLMEANSLNNMPQAKNMKEIEASTDSMNLKLDSVGKTYLEEAKNRWYNIPSLKSKDSIALAQKIKENTIPFDSLIAKVAPDQMQVALRTSKATVNSCLSELEWKSMITSDGDNNIRRHWVFWHQKITYSLACLFFFFIGAPLGAIIRKGGLGMPTVISVMIFIFYYIIDASGMKMARNGSWDMIYGMWISSAILLPFGIFVTYKANKDSVVFNGEVYANLFKRLLGLRSRRSIYRKEVIINDPDYSLMLQEVKLLREECSQYNDSKRLLLAPSYLKTFFHYQEDSMIVQTNERMESIVEMLSNTRSLIILQALNKLPIIYTQAHVTPLHREYLNVIAGVVFPLGIILWLRIWHFRIRLRRDLLQIVKCCDYMLPEIQKLAEASANKEENSPSTNE